MTNPAMDAAVGFVIIYSKWLEKVKPLPRRIAPPFPQSPYALRAKVGISNRS
jgi:hypothetical protein